MISRRHFLRLAGGLGATGISTVAYGFGEPALRLRVTRYNIQPPQWPAGFKLKIAVIADLHACDPWMSLERIGSIVERTNALNPDITVLLGDYVAGHRKVTRFIPCSEWAPVLAGLRAPLGVHAVLGNHDYWEDKAVQRDGQGDDDRAARARSCRHSGLRKRCGAADQGGPAVLARRASAINWPIMPARRFRPVRRIGVDDLGATLAKVTDDAPDHSAGARARRRGAGAGTGRAAALRSYPWRPGAAVRMVAGGAVRKADWPMATPARTATSSSPAASAAASCRSASASRRKSCW